MKRPSKNSKKTLGHNKIVKLLQQYFDEQRDYWGVNFDEFPGCCGIGVLSELDSDTGKLEQASTLVNTFSEYKVSQIFLTDKVSSRRWAEAKEHAIHGPVTRNKKSGNNIKAYIHTQETLKSFIENFTDSDLKELFAATEDVVDDLD